MTADADEAIQAFNERHNLDPGPQFRQLGEELGELAEALNRGHDREIVEECADVQFVARSISLLMGGDPEAELREVALENAQKNTETDGNKVTKA